MYIYVHVYTYIYIYILVRNIMTIHSIIIGRRAPMGAGELS